MSTSVDKSERRLVRALASARNTTSSTGKEMSTTAASCGFYALQPNEVCRQPRTCFDCLNVKIPSEPQGCMISPTGTCESMDNYSVAMDFRANPMTFDNSSVDNVSGGWYHVFPSTNTSYCAAQDPACVKCRKIAVEAAANSSFLALTTKMCAGANGCVCIVNCESPTWQTIASKDCPTTTASPLPLTTTPTRQISSVSPIETRRMFWLFAIAQVPLLFLLICVRLRDFLRERQKTHHTPSLQLELSGWHAMRQELIEQDKNRNPQERTESVLHSALPPSGVGSLSYARESLVASDLPRGGTET